MAHKRHEALEIEHEIDPLVENCERREGALKLQRKAPRLSVALGGAFAKLDQPQHLTREDIADAGDRAARSAIDEAVEDLGVDADHKRDVVPTPGNVLSGVAERFLAAELIREQILRHTRQEVPHSVAVLVDRWEDSWKITKIAATIYVERDGQKAIVIGAGGAALKKVGTLARYEIEKMVGHKVFLELFVKVQKDWRDNPEFLNSIDWRSMRGGELESDQGPVS